MDKKIAQKLLEIGAVSLKPNDPFTWSSGIKSPIYCDNRLTLSYPEVRTIIAEGLCRIILERFPNVDVIAGTATAGIPHAAWVSDRLNLPMCYVRSKRKEHGKGSQVEGKVSKGQNVVVIEDLISTGKSSLEVVSVLQSFGCHVLGVVSIFSYELAIGKENFEKANVPYDSLSNFSALMEVAKEKGFITEIDIDQIRKWMKSPSEWKGDID